MKSLKQKILIVIFAFSTIATFSQQNSLNLGIALLSVKDKDPYGGGILVGYEYHIPKIKFLAVEARINAGKLIGNGLYSASPIKEWNYNVDYFMAGIIPRFYYGISEDINLFLDTEVGVSAMMGKTLFSEQNNWNATNSFASYYYSVKVGIQAPINDKMKISFSLGYMSMDIANMLNSRLSTINYRFKNQTIDIGTLFILHVIL
jgi:hypothetical protein